MLPTEDKQHAIIKKNTGILLKQTINLEYSGIKHQLYFTTDEEINLGDKVLNTVTGEIYSAELDDIDDFRENDPEFGYTDFNKKIIATTDPKIYITIGEHYNAYNKELPQIPQDFIKAYCEQGGIDEVDVEYEYHKVWDKRTEELLEKYLLLKVDTKDNTITTHSIVEKMYSKDDMKKMWIHLGEQGWGDSSGEGFDQWIKENL